MAELLTRTRTRLGAGRTAFNDSLGPGIVVAIFLALVARFASSAIGISALTIAVVIGMVLGNIPAPTEQLRPGLKFVGKKLLRIGVIALGMRLSIDSIGQLGVGVISTIVATVTATFFGTQWLGKRLGLSGPLSLLIATGYSICGASAIAAMQGSSDADEEEVAVAIGLVTLAGTIAMFSLPLLGELLALTDDQYAIWAVSYTHLTLPTKRIV